MLRNNVLSVLNAYKKNRTRFKLYDDTFGTYFELFETFSYITFDEYVLVVDTTKKKKMEIKFSDILTLDLIVDEDTRIDLIKKAPNFYTAYMIAKGSLTENVIDVLNERKNEKSFDEQLEMIKEAIKTDLRLKHSNLSEEKVLEFLYINTPLKDKNAEKLEISDLRAILSKIDTAIEKIENKSVF